jgi:protein TonB
VKRNSRARRYLPAALIALIVPLIGLGAFAFIRGVLSGAPVHPKQVVQEIHVIRPPPPPPDAPPPPPPPPEEKVDVTEPEKPPDPTPSNEPPPSEQLGLDAAGGAGGDAFGLVGRQGGRDLLASGGSAYTWYAGILKNDILDLLQDAEEMRRGSYTVSVRLWLRDDGTVERYRVVQSTGNRERDQMLEKKLGQLTRISQPPPADTPEPITVEIRTRG